MSRTSALSTFVVLTVLAVAPPGAAPAASPPLVSDTVRAWNAHALNALANAATAPIPGAAQPPQVAALHLAMVQLAVYDAVNAIDGGHEAYLEGLPPASSSGSLDAAAATAAHHVLVGLGISPVPPLPQSVRDRLDVLYGDALAAIPDGSAKADGIASGEAAAAAILAERDGDGRYVPFSFAEGLAAGEWRPTSGVTDPFAWASRVEPFTLESTSQFRTRGPRELASRRYATDYNEVKELGSLTNSGRSPEQLAIAQFYTVSPVELFNRAFRGLTEARGLSLVDEARFFALLNVSAADALIGCWDDKAWWGFWRPVTAIRLGDTDGNSSTVGDAAWTPFSVTPPYPEHSSGYNCATGSMMHAAQAFLGGRKAEFSVTNLSTGVTRIYKHFGDVVDDTIDARVFQGIHFRTGDEQGAQLGRNVARWVEKHYFKREKGGEK